MSKKNGYRTLHVAFERVTGTAEYVGDDESDLRKRITEAGDDTFHYNIVGPYVKAESPATPLVWPDYENWCSRWAATFATCPSQQHEKYRRDMVAEVRALLKGDADGR